jgi:hypothetical protein
MPSHRSSIQLITTTCCAPRRAHAARKGGNSRTVVSSPNPPDPPAASTGAASARRPPFLPRTADRHGPVRISVASSARRASPWSKATVHGRCIRGDQQQGLVASPGADAAFAGSGGQLLAFIRRERDVPVGLLREAVSIPCLTTIGYLLSNHGDFPFPDGEAGTP